MVQKPWVPRFRPSKGRIESEPVIPEREAQEMYIGLGTVLVIVLIVLLIYLLA